MNAASKTILTARNASPGRTAHKRAGSPPAAPLTHRARTGERRYVFPGTKDGRPIRDLECVWVKVRDAAGLQRLRGVHALRHQFASAGLTLYPLAMVGAAMGHSTATMTARYAHLSDPQRKEVAAGIGGALAPKPSAGVALAENRNGAQPAQE